MAETPSSRTKRDEGGKCKKMDLEFWGTGAQHGGISYHISPRAFPPSRPLRADSALAVRVGPLPPGGELPAHLLSCWLSVFCGENEQLIETRVSFILDIMTVVRRVFYISFSFEIEINEMFRGP